MANPSSRGHQALFKVFKNGEEIVIDTIMKVSVAMDSSFSRHFYVGNPIPQGDQTVEGWSGSFDMEVTNDVVEEFIDGLITNNLNGFGFTDDTFLIREEFSDNTVATYIYVDCQFKLSTEIGTLKDKITKRIDFQAATRVKI